METKMEKQETATMDVIVHKANIALQNGESLHEFSNLLSAAAKAYALQQLNVTTDKGGAWLVEAYSDKVVLETWEEGKDPRYTYQQIGYTRDKDGKFSFDNMTEVKRVTTFKPAVPAIGITKSEEATEKASEETAEVTEPQIWEPMDAAPEEPVQKSLFGDII